VPSFGSGLCRSVARYARGRCRAPGLAVALLVVALAAWSAWATPVSAEVLGLEVTRREPVADGRAWGLAGPYEKLAGSVQFAVDPGSPANRAIVDLERAPRGDDGRVHFRADFYLLRPMTPEKGNGALLLEVPNRGGKAIVRYFDRGAARTFDPSTAEDFGDGFLLRHGFTLAWVGWQWDVPPNGDDLLTLDPVPVELRPGEPADALEGLVRADHVFTEPSQVLELGDRGHIAYPVADPDDPRNVLTVRDTRLGPRRTIPRNAWHFEGSTVVYSQGFEPGEIYEAVYASRKPVVVGLGLAAVRDFASYLRYAADSPAPVERALGMGISQTGRFLRHFLWQGFNVDEAGRPAFDGLMIHTAGGGRGSFNHRYGQPSRDGHPFSAFVYPTDVFPFSGTVQTDPETGRTDGLLRVLQEHPRTLPRVFLTNTGYEYWGRAASLIHTTPDGRADVPLSPSVRLYQLAGAQHFVDRFPPHQAGAPDAAVTAYPADPADFLWALRALLLAMDDWVADGTEPPPSRYPKVADGTLVEPADLAFPTIPWEHDGPEHEAEVTRVDAPRNPHLAYRVDYGARFWQDGIVTKQPPAVGKPFGVRVPQVGPDGNPLAGLQMPEVAVPLATYTPWNRRAARTGAPNELADFRGSFFPLPVTEAQRRATGDPRPSIEHLYGTRDAYLGRYATYAATLARQRYLLDEDLPELLERADALWNVVAGREAGGGESRGGRDRPRGDGEGQ